MASAPDSTTLNAVILEAIRSNEVEFHTALPGVIELFDATTQRAKVRIPLLRDYRDDEGNETTGDWPILPSVPVWMPHAGGFHVTMPVAPGDECLVLFLERDSSKWFDNASEQSPETRRLHDISDGVALVGLNSNPQQIASYNASDLEISNAAGSQSVILRANGDIEIANAKLGLGAGAEDVLDLLDEILGLFLGLTVNITTGVVITPSAGTVAAIQARIAAVKV